MGYSERIGEEEREANVGVDACASGTSRWEKGVSRSWGRRCIFGKLIFVGGPGNDCIRTGVFGISWGVEAGGEGRGEGTAGQTISP
jgi:hypothetical protein